MKEDRNLTGSTARVMFLNQTAQMGGAEISLCNLITSLDRRRWEPEVILFESGPLVERLRRQGLPVEIIEMSTSLRLLKRHQVGRLTEMKPAQIVGGLMQVNRLRRALSRAHADLVHANSLKAAVLGGLAGKLARLPVIWQIHSVISEEKRIEKRTVRSMQRLAGWLPGQIICNSQATAACFAGNPRVTIVPCGVEAAVFQPSGHHPGPRPRVGMIARFSPEKGQEILVDAVESLLRRGIELECVFAGTALFGEEGYEERIRERAAGSPLGDRVRFAGFVDDVPSLLRDLDIVVHPSIEPEGFGQAVAEAMMAAKPVVVAAAGGSAELVDDGVTGRVVPPGDAHALASAMEDLISDPVRAAHMGRRAREVALERYDVRRTTRAIEGVYERALAQA
jgi:glycosyltransferase involved in cell wall biosynthesis